MAYEGGPKKFGTKPAGARSAGGPRKPYGPRKEFGDKPAFGEKRPYSPRPPREGGDRPYTPRPPREGGSFGEKRPYTPRAEGGRSYGPKKDFGDRPARPYTPREGGSSFGEKRPYSPRSPREGGDRPYTPRPPREGGSSYGERKPYTPREGGTSFGEKRPYTPRKDFGDRPARPYTPRPPREGGSSYGEKRPYTPREGGSSFGEKRPYTPRPPRDYTPAGDAEGQAPRVWGDAKRPRYAEKTSGKANFERKPTTEDAEVLANRDGWLVGYHAVLAALGNGRRKVREVWLLADATGELATLLAAHPEWPVSVKAREDFNREFADSVHQGVAALVGNLHQPSLPELLATKPQLLVALDQVTDPHNLGAIVRSAAAFGAKGVLVTEHRAAGVNATAAKAAAGALESVPVAEITNLANALKMLQENGYFCVGLAGEAEADFAAAVSKLKAEQPICLVVGSEGEGLRRLTRENCDVLAKLSITSAVESLNVSVATGVALALLKQR